MTPRPYTPPVVGATFQPGGLDDFLMPEASPIDVVSPLPQKVMPELPAQMQNDLARLELDATNPIVPVKTLTAQSSIQPQSSINRLPVQASQLPPQPPQKKEPLSNNREPNYTQDRASAPRLSAVPVQSPAIPGAVATSPSGPSSEPNFSEFPKLTNRPAHIPESDDERRESIEKARIPVLQSDDIEMQLNWAQDALTFVDAFLELEDRLVPLNGPRPPTPSIEHNIKEDAKNIVEFLATQQHPRADFMKSMWLEFGRFGYREDKREAYRGYSRSAQNGYYRAEYRMGMQFEATKEPFEALQHYNAGLEAGDSACCYRMGMMSLLGQLGQPQDFDRAVRLIRQAADTADANAPQGAYVFGMLQARELPQIQVPEAYLPVDIPSARRYIEKAALLGFSKAQLKLGAAYELCTLGCEFDPTLSLHYNRLAASQGEAEAEMAISKWFLCGYEGLFQKNEKKAYVFGERAALSGLPMAQFAMGYFSEIGMHVPVNLDKALEWYGKAAKAGNKDAAARIEGISKSRTLSKKDHENIAVSRIKSQHGSKRTERPERFTTPVVVMPTIIADDAPPPRTGTAINPVPVQTRPTSVTPYPDDRPVSVTPYPDDRPVSRTPYPVDDDPRHMPTAGFLVAGQRPASVQMQGKYATGNPHSSRPRPPAGPGLQVPVAGAPFLRPHSTGGNPNAPGPGYPSGRRVVSGSPIPPGPYQGLGRPVPSNSIRPQNDWRPSNTPIPPRIDSQYSGDFRPYDRNRPPQSVYSSASYEPRIERPPDNGRGYQNYQNSPPGPSARPPERPAKVPLSAAGPNYQNGPVKSTVSLANQNATPKMSGGLPPAQPTMQQSMQQPGSRPPGKTPKTFEEMGVPAGKQDSECIIM